jgi:16S rRNA (cytidine1402-2'-O)-methyltransferase
MAELYMIASPIGNLGDCTFRAIEVLKKCDLIIAEDTRHSQKLLKHYEISGKKITSVHARTSEEKIKKLCQEISQENLSAGYLSDAGTPCISDPGFVLINIALNFDIKLIPVGGISALTSFISVSGLPAHNFTFHGFIPHKKGRQTMLKNISTSNNTDIFYESVHRFPRLLEELKENLNPDRIIVVGREISKIYEDFFRGNISEALDYFNEENTRGEFVVGIAPLNFKFKK